MALWFRHGTNTVGADGNVIRAADYAALINAESMMASASDQCERMVEKAQSQAQALQSEARADAETLLARAQALHDQAWEAGFAKGFREASDRWAAQALQEGAARHDLLRQQVDRLSSIVATAVERIVEVEDRASLIRAAVRTVSRLVQETTLLTLRVAAEDRDAALRAISGSPVEIEVVADAGLAPGSCLFESERGVVDAGLPTQLAAIRRAIGRAVHQVASEELDASVATAQSHAASLETSADAAKEDEHPAHAPVQDEVPPLAADFEAPQRPSR